MHNSCILEYLTFLLSSVCFELETFDVHFIEADYLQTQVTSKSANLMNLLCYSYTEIELLWVCSNIYNKMTWCLPLFMCISTIKPEVVSFFQNFIEIKISLHIGDNVKSLWSLSTLTFPCLQKPTKGWAFWCLSWLEIFCFSMVLSL